MSRFRSFPIRLQRDFSAWLVSFDGMTLKEQALNNSKIDAADSSRDAETGLETGFRMPA